MKRLFGKIIAIGLALTVMPTTGYAFNEEEFCTFKMRDIGANSILFADDTKAEQIKNELTELSKTDVMSDSLLNNYPAVTQNITDRPIRTITALTKGTFDNMKKSDTYIYDKGGKIPFNITTDLDNVNGIIVGGGITNEQTLNLNTDKSLSCLYLYSVASHSDHKITVKLNYADNSSETLSDVKMTAPEWNTNNLAEGVWSEKGSLRYNYAYTNGVCTSYSNDAERHAYIVTIPINVEKKLQNITMQSTDSWRSVAFIGVTGKIVTEEEMDNYYVRLLNAELAKLPENPEDITKENYTIYNEIIEKIETFSEYFNNADSEKIENYLRCKERIEEILKEYSPYIPVNFAKSYNAKIYSEENKAIPDFNDVLQYIARYQQNAEKEWVPGTDRAMNINAFESAKASDGYIYSSGGVPFEVDYNGGLAYGGRKKPIENETMYIDGINAEKLHFFIAAAKDTDSSRTNKIIVYYTDGTKTATNYEHKGYVTGDSGITDNYIAMSRAYLKDANGTPDTAVRSTDIVTVNTDFSKTIQSIEFNTSDAYGGWAVLGLTAQMPEQDALAQRIIQIAAALKSEQAEGKSYEINSLDTMVKHYEKYRMSNDNISFAEAEKIIEEYKNNAVIIENIENITSYKKYIVDVTFKNEIDTGDIKNYIYIERNGTEESQFDILIKDNKLSIMLKNDFSYTKIKLVIKKGIKGLNPDYQLEEDYTYIYTPYKLVSLYDVNMAADGINITSMKEAKGKNLRLTATLKSENAQANQTYFIAAALVSERNKFIKNYVKVGVLEKKGDTTDVDFEFAIPDGDTNKIQIFVLDGLTNMILLEKPITIK